MRLPEDAAAYELSQALATLMQQQGVGMPITQVAAVLTTALGIVIRQMPDPEHRDELLAGVISALRKRLDPEAGHE